MYDGQSLARAFWAIARRYLARKLPVDLLHGPEVKASWAALMASCATSTRDTTEQYKHQDKVGVLGLFTLNVASTSRRTKYRCELRQQQAESIERATLTSSSVPAGIVPTLLALNGSMTGKRSPRRGLTQRPPMNNSREGTPIAFGSRCKAVTQLRLPIPVATNMLSRSPVDVTLVCEPCGRSSQG